MTKNTPVFGDRAIPLFTPDGKPNPEHPRWKKKDTK